MLSSVLGKIKLLRPFQSSHPTARAARTSFRNISKSKRQCEEREKVICNSTDLGETIYIRTFGGHLNAE